MHAAPQPLLILILLLFFELGRGAISSTNNATC
jgi:hypothetical protein